MEEESLLSTHHLRIQLQPRAKEGAAEALTVARAHRGLAQAGFPAGRHDGEEW